MTQQQSEPRPLVAGWLLLALSSLALSTLCAVLLVAGRMPLPDAGGVLRGLFGRALALHVTFAVVVWFLSCAAGFWTLAAGGKGGPWRWSAMALSGTGLAGMILPLFSASATPVLANYVPVLDHPVFLAGLVLFMAGVAVAGTGAAAGMLRGVRAGQTWRFGALLSLVAAGVAFLALAASLWQTGQPTGPDSFEALAWGPGHVLQFVHVLLLMSVWIVLGEELLGKPVGGARWLAALLLLAALPLLAVPVIYASYPVGGPEFRRAFTLLMAWGCWPAAALLGARLLWKMASAGRGILGRPGAPALLLSVALFLAGCVLGALIRGDSTMVPAHYHGTVGAVTLAYMAFGYRLLREWGCGQEGAWERRQPIVQGLGLLILALALAWSGSIGVPRKTLHADVMLEFPAYFAAMGLAGVGGLLAVAGAGLFVFNVVRRLPFRRTDGRRRDVRPAAFAATALLTAVTGYLIASWPSETGTLVAPAPASIADPKAHVVQKREEEVARRFAEGVKLLAAKDYQAAASAMHRVLELAPQMPEAHVNMGFALIGMANHAMARDFFEGALALRTTQMNAYYGLAVALEGTGDLEGALGAMRTFVHRSNPDDPFVRKAHGAIWEWETALAAQRGQATPPTAALPENGKGAIRYPITEKKLN